MKINSYVLDTNVLLQDSNVFYKFLNKGNVYISSNVVRELDTFKTRYDIIGKNSRSHMRFLNSLIEENELRLVDGISIDGCQYKLYSFFVNLPKDSTADDEIYEYCKNKVDEDIVVVTNDINLKLRLNSDDTIKVRTESFSEENFEHDYKIYTGFTEVLVPTGVVGDLFDTSVGLTLNDLEECDSLETHPNQFLNFRANDGSKSSALVRIIDRDEPLCPIRSKFSELEKYGIFPRNREQVFALNLLLDPDIKIVTLIGPAGSGKTLLALASALSQTERNTYERKSSKKMIDPDRFSYKKIVISRPIQPMGKDIGFLPGTMQEKMGPWVQPIVDNLEFLFGGDSMTVEELMTSGTIQVEAPTFIRGRTINNAFIIIDEVQNLNRHELKTILTRVGEGSKIVLTGDIEQIDNKDLDETTNGLTYVVEKFKYYDISGHITLVKGERSEIATLASKVL